jgi:hypothetical protein
VKGATEAASKSPPCQEESQAAEKTPEHEDAPQVDQEVAQRQAEHVQLQGVEQTARTQLQDSEAPQVDQELALSQAERVQLQGAGQTAHTQLQDNVPPAQAEGEETPHFAEQLQLSQDDKELLAVCLGSAEPNALDAKSVAGDIQSSEVHIADFEGGDPEGEPRETSSWEPDPMLEQRYEDLSDLSSLDGDESPAHKRVKLYAKARRTAKVAYGATHLPRRLERACELEPENVGVAPTVQPEHALLLSTAWNGGRWVHLWERSVLLEDRAAPEQELTQKAPQLATDELQGTRAERTGRKRRAEDLVSVTVDNVPNDAAVDKHAEPEGKKPRVAQLRRDADLANEERGQQDHALEQSLSPKTWGANLTCDAALEPPPQPSEPEPACLGEARQRSEAELVCEVTLEPCPKQDARTAAAIRKEVRLLLGKDAGDHLLATCQEKILRDGRGGVQRFLVDSAGATLTLVQRKNVAPM